MDRGTTANADNNGPTRGFPDYILTPRHHEKSINTDINMKPKYTVERKKHLLCCDRVANVTTMMQQKNQILNWVSDCCSTLHWTIVRSALPWQEHVTSRWDDVHYVLDMSEWVDISHHSGTLIWFRANQSLILLLSATCIAENQKIPILESLGWPRWVLSPRSTTPEESTLTIAPLMRWIKKSLKILNEESETTNWTINEWN
jgi:hypothetical protein